MTFDYSSTTVGEITKALIAIQQEIVQSGIYNDKKGARNSYATLSNLYSTIVPIAGRHGVAVLQSIVTDGRLNRPSVEEYSVSLQVYMCLKLLHTSGEFVASYDYLDSIDTNKVLASVADAGAFSQARGTVKTYVARHQLKHMFCIPLSDEDFDDRVQYVRKQATLNAKQVEALALLTKQTKDPQGTYKKILSYYKVPRFDDIQACKFEDIKQHLINMSKE